MIATILDGKDALNLVKLLGPDLSWMDLHSAKSALTACGFIISPVGKHPIVPARFRDHDVAMEINRKTVATILMVWR